MDNQEDKSQELLKEKICQIYYSMDFTRRTFQKVADGVQADFPDLCKQCRDKSAANTSAKFSITWSQMVGFVIRYWDRKQASL